MDLYSKDAVFYSKKQDFGIEFSCTYDNIFQVFKVFLQQLSFLSLPVKEFGKKSSIGKDFIFSEPAVVKRSMRASGGTYASPQPKLGASYG